MITFSTVKIQKFKIQKCTLFKKICKTIFSLYLENEKRYRKRISGFEIHEKRICCGKNLSKLIFSGNERTKYLFCISSPQSLYLSLFFNLSFLRVCQSLQLCLQTLYILLFCLSSSLYQSLRKQSLNLSNNLSISVNLFFSLTISPFLY